MQHILPFTYFGSISYFQILAIQNVILDGHEYFVKQTERSRCLILGANGPLHLSVPVNKPNGNKTFIKDVLIAYTTDWQRIHWKAIESAYASASYFDDYAEEIRLLIFSKNRYLIDLNMAGIELINKWLGLNLAYRVSSAFVDEGIDFRSLQFDAALIKPYFRIFPVSSECAMHLSILDLIFSEGPMSRNWLLSR